MSSLAKFRKYQKPALAILGVLLMISFTFSDLNCFYQATGSGAAAVVARTSSGKLTEADLDNLRRARATANQFVSTLIGGKEPFGSAESEEDVVRTWLLAKKAEQMGIKVDNQDITEFIRRITESMKRFGGHAVTDTHIQNAIAQMGKSEVAVYAALRTELMAAKVRQMMENSFVPITPAEQWDLYLRGHRRLLVEALPIPVAAFFDKVPDPSESEQQEFFERYAEIVADPDSPQPGFKLPHVARFQYVTADLDSFIKEAREQIKPEEIEADYEKNKEQYPYDDLPAPKDGIAPSSDPTAPERPLITGPVYNHPSPFFRPSQPAPSGGTQPPDLGGSAPGAGDKTPDENPATPPEKGAPSGNEPDAQQPDGKRSEEAPAKENSSAPCAPQDEPNSDGEKSRLDAAEPDTTGKPDTTGAKTQPPVDGASTTQPDDKKDDSKPEGDKKDDAFSLQAILAQYRLPRNVRDGAKPKYLPLWAVEDDIRNKLARERANKTIDTLFADITAALEQYQKAYNRYLDRHGPEPSKPDLTKLLSPGLKLEPETPWYTRQELQENTQFARLFVAEARNYFPVTAYERLGTYEAVAPVPMGEPMRYLIWKTEDRPSARASDLSEEYLPGGPKVKDEVIKAWKLKAARGMARQRAEELAAQARSSRQSLLTLREGGQQGQLLKQFTWINPGDGFMTPPAISKVPGVHRPGEEFMRTVYTLPQDGIGIAMNAPQDTAYVVKVIGHDFVLGGRAQVSEESVRTMFAGAARRGRDQVLEFARQLEMQSRRQAWFKALEAEAGLEWVREPRRIEREELE